MEQMEAARAAFRIICPPGLGDFLRGSICLHQYCTRYNIPLYLSFAGHPFGVLLEKPLLEFDPIALQRVENSELYEYLVQNPHHIHFPVEKRHFETDLIIKRQGFVRVITNSFPSNDVVNKECKKFIRQFLKPTEKLSEQIAKTLNQLQVEPKKYKIIHIRLGDRFINNCPNAWKHLSHNLTNDVLYVIEDILNRFAANLITDQKVILLSDSGALKEILHTKYGWKILDNTPIFSGAIGNCKDEEGTDCYSSFSVFEQTLVDFFLLVNSAEIFQVSAYAWGSGFSDRCHDLFDVPIFRLQLPGWVNGQYG